MPKIQETTRFVTAYGPKESVGYRYGATMTKQSHKDECDVNKIVERFTKTGVLEFVNDRQPQFGDVTGIDFFESMRIVAQANEMFAALPAKVRDRFGNDPKAFLDFMEDPQNRSQAVLMGLLEERAAGAQEGSPKRRATDQGPQVQPEAEVVGAPPVEGGEHTSLT